MLAPSEYERLLHDLKRMAKVIKIFIKEENKDDRDVIGSLLSDEADRLAGDIEDLREKK